MKRLGMNEMGGNRMRALMLSAALLLTPTLANAQDASEWFSKYKPAFLDCATDNSEFHKLGREVLSGGDCGWSKHDKRNRGEFLTVTYRHLLEAATKGDIQDTVQNASDMNNAISNSGQYELCWKRIVQACTLLQQVDQQFLDAAKQAEAIVPARKRN
jgi:hypothetical protein